MSEKHESRVERLLRTKPPYPTGLTTEEICAARVINSAIFLDARIEDIRDEIMEAINNRQG